MAQQRGGQRKRGWLLANLIGGGVLIVALSFGLSASPGSGNGTPNRSALKVGDPASRGAVDAASCTQFQQMVGQCSIPTTTTTTTTPSAPTPPAGGGGGGGTTTYETHAGTPARTATPSAPTPAPPPSAPGGSGTAPPLSSDPGPCSDAAPPVQAPSGSWHCTLDDEFNGTSFDTSKWQAQLTSESNYTTGPAFNQACYVDNPQTISESGGYLNLSVVETAQPINCPGIAGADSFVTRYEAGEVVSYQKWSQEYGYFEVRAAMPASTVPGLQETLWLYPEDLNLYGPWPDSGEIDFAEFYSLYPNLDVPVAHYPGSSSDPNATSDSCAISGQATAGQFHDYAVLWTPTTLTYYYDGMTCTTDVYGPHVTYPDAAPAPFNQPFFLNFTAALGSASGDQFTGAAPLPATTQIDWVRVWQYG